MVATGGPGLFTQSNPEDRRVTPDEVGDRALFKVVYVVLESQYQSSLSAACKRINAGQVRHPRCRHACCVLACCPLWHYFLASLVRPLGRWLVALV